MAKRSPEAQGGSGEAATDVGQARVSLRVETGRAWQTLFTAKGRPTVIKAAHRLYQVNN